MYASSILLDSTLPLEPVLRRRFLSGCLLFPFLLGGFGCQGREPSVQAPAPRPAPLPMTQALLPWRTAEGFGFADPSGKRILPARYEDVGPFSQGLA